MENFLPLWLPSAVTCRAKISDSVLCRWAGTGLLVLVLGQFERDSLVEADLAVEKVEAFEEFEKVVVDRIFNTTCFCWSLLLLLVFDGELTDIAGEIWIVICDSMEYHFHNNRVKKATFQNFYGLVSIHGTHIDFFWKLERFGVSANLENLEFYFIEYVSASVEMEVTRIFWHFICPLSFGKGTY